MKKGVKKIGALLATLLIMWTSFLTSLANAVDLDLSKASVTFTMPDYDVHLKAISEPNGYTIVFNGNWNTNSGTTMAALPMTYDASWTLTTNTYTKVWYTFLWWNIDSSAITAKYTDGEEVKNLATTWSITLYAIWSANTYQVRFNPNPGEDTLNEIVWTMSNQDFTYDTTWALTSGAYTRAWYTFLWWSTGSTATAATYTNWQAVSNLTTISWDIVDLYAIWSANTWVAYTVKHYKQDIWAAGWKLADTDNLNWTTYELVTPDRKTYEWFTFSWTESKRIKWDGSTVFEYYYTRNTYKVTLHEGRWVASVSWGWTYYYDENVSVSATLKPWYTGFTWEWDKTTGIFTMPASKVEMTGKAIPIIYTISLNVWTWTIDLWSGAISWQTEITYDVEQNVVVPRPTKTWYDFQWWSWTNLDNLTLDLVISSGTRHEDLVYEAIWSPRSDVHYLVRHYIKVVWEDRYEQTWDDVLYTTWVADETITLADYKRADIPCVTYTWWSLTQSNSWLTTAIETGSAIVQPDGSTVIYLYYTRNIHSVTLTKDEHIASVNLSGTIGNTVTESFECWATVTIDANPDTWYHFLRWDDLWPDFLNPVNP